MNFSKSFVKVLPVAMALANYWECGLSAANVTCGQRTCSLKGEDALLWNKTGAKSKLNDPRLKNRRRPRVRM